THKSRKKTHKLEENPHKPEENPQHLPASAQLSTSHMRNMSGSSSNSAGSLFGCNACGKKYLRQSHLRRHEATHTDNPSIACPSCSKTFARRDVARRHMQSCVESGQEIYIPTKRRGKKPHACDNCSQKRVSCDSGTPCSRCLSRQHQCSYQRINCQESPRYTTDGTTPIKITWLLSFTDPSAFGTSESIAREDSPSNESCDMAWLSMLEPTFENEASCATWLTELFPSVTAELPEDYTLKTISSPLLSKRVEELIAQLSKTRQIMALSNATDLPDFDISLAKSVFTVPNLEYFLGIYAYTIWSYHPILHIPTFSYEQVSLPLLLAIFLLGALFSPTMDHALSARHFFHISEEFIFNHPTFRQLLLGSNSPTDPTIETIEILQAALTILIIQCGINDQLTRRRIRVEKNPLLNAAVRLSGVLRIKHRISITDYTAKDWTIFIQHESCIRLAHWTQIYASLMASALNSILLISVSEMIGDMPCREKPFEAETAQKFEQLFSLEPAGIPSKPLADFIFLLLSDACPGLEDESFSRLIPTDLFIIISGLIVSVAKANCLTSTLSNALHRACRRWKALWD
ncbi:hypothetical protein EDB80DRAFT_830585, partial [Ilyonectria destructans]